MRRTRHVFKVEGKKAHSTMVSGTKSPVPSPTNRETPVYERTYCTFHDVGQSFALRGLC